MRPWIMIATITQLLTWKVYIFQVWFQGKMTSSIFTEFQKSRRAFLSNQRQPVVMGNYSNKRQNWHLSVYLNNTFSRTDFELYTKKSCGLIIHVPGIPEMVVLQISVQHTYKRHDFTNQRTTGKDMVLFNNGQFLNLKKDAVSINQFIARQNPWGIFVAKHLKKRNALETDASKIKIRRVCHSTTLSYVDSQNDLRYLVFLLIVVTFPKPQQIPLVEISNYYWYQPFWQLIYRQNSDVSFCNLLYLGTNILCR